MNRPAPLKNLGTCPICGSSELNAIWCGDPIGDPDLYWPVNVQMGGCAKIGNDPNRACLQCGHRWISPDGNALGAEEPHPHANE